MTATEALELALKKENASIKLYTKLAAEYSEIKELLFALLNEEEKHKKMIEARIAEINNG